MYLYSKLQNLKNILYDGDIQNYSINLAEKILTSNHKPAVEKDKSQKYYSDLNNVKKIEQILNKMKLLLKNNNN